MERKYTRLRLLMTVILYAGVLPLGQVYGQTAVPLRDISDVLHSIFAKKKVGNSKTDTIAPVLRPAFSGLPAVGYTLTTKFAVTLTGNVAFRLDTGARISTVTSSVSYTERKQFTFPFESNIWTRNNNYDFVGDMRFMNYHLSTFGLGSNSSMDDKDPMKYNYVRFYEVVLRKITPAFFAGAGYILDWHYNISDQGIAGHVTDYAQYGAESSTLSTGFTLNTLYDTRDNSISAQKGIYASATYRNNLNSLGSTRSWQSMILDVRKYVHFPVDTRNTWAFWSYDWLVVGGKPPYLSLPSTGWDTYTNTGRGYIQGRFRGKEMVYLESEYRFPLTTDGLFGAVVFLNGETFSGYPGNRLESVQPGMGGGLRIKLNSASRTNLDIDYGFGTQGSKGLFVNIGEAF